MKKYIIYTLIVIIAVFLGSCNKDDTDTKCSIFNPTEVCEPNEFDKWLLDNHVYTYNIQVKYRPDDNETDAEYHLVPAKYDNATTLAKIVKFVWMEAHDEIWGIDMTRTYVPKLFQFIGDIAYTESGMILGQAEGGTKITLFCVNEIDKSNLSVAQLNEYYFKTMHHEFTYILNQKKAYDTSCDRISESDYIGSSWYRVFKSAALQKGFISPYAMDRATEDFTETATIYVTNDASIWEDMLVSAGITGRPIVEEKFEIIFDYILNSWGLDSDRLREIALRRQSETTESDLSML